MKLYYIYNVSEDKWLCSDNYEWRSEGDGIPALFRIHEDDPGPHLAKILEYVYYKNNFKIICVQVKQGATVHDFEPDFTVDALQVDLDKIKYYNTGFLAEW
jgi:hypothetical protein